MEKLVALTASGLAYGCTITLVALGFLVLYKATGVINFAHGDLVTLAAFLGVYLVVQSQLPLVLGYLAVLIAMALIGVLLQRVAFAPLRGKSTDVCLVATLGVALAIRAALAIWQGPEVKALPSPVGTGYFKVAGALISHQSILIVAVSVAVVGACVLLFARTGFGRQVRALATDEEAAMLNGVRVKRVSTAAFALSAVIAGAAGLLVAPSSGVDLTIGFDLMLSAIGAALLGGFNGLLSTAVAGVSIGLLQQVVGGYLFRDYSEAIPYIVMLAIIALRPDAIPTPSRQVRV